MSISNLHLQEVKPQFQSFTVALKEDTAVKPVELLNQIIIIIIFYKHMHFVC